VKRFLYVTRGRHFPVNEARQSQTVRHTGDTVACECTAAAGSRIILYNEASFSDVEMSDTRYTLHIVCILLVCNIRNHNIPAFPYYIPQAFARVTREAYYI